MFSDGTSPPIDVIVWCTGYTISVPYVDRDVLGAAPADLSLYKRMFHHEIDDLFFIGLVQTTGSAIPVVERQSALLAEYLTGGYALPGVERRRADAEKRALASAKRYGARGPAAPARGVRRVHARARAGAAQGRCGAPGATRRRR